MVAGSGAMCWAGRGGGAYQGGWKCDGGKTSYYHWSASAEVLFRYLDKIVVNCPPRSILQSCDGFGDYVLIREVDTQF